MSRHRRSHPHQRRRPPHRAPRPLRRPPRRQVPRSRAEARAQRRGLRRLAVRPAGDGDGRAERRRRPAQGGVRPRAAEPRGGAARVLRRPRAGEGHGRRRRARLDELPVVPHLHGPHVLPRGRRRPVERPRAGLQRLAHRRVVRRLPRSLHPDGGAGDLGPGGDRRRGPALRRQGLPLAQLHREPGRPRLPQLPRRALGPGVAGLRRHRHGAVDPPRVVGSPVDPGRRLARPT